MNPTRSTQRHVIIKTAEVTDRVLKAVRESRLVTYSTAPRTQSADFSTETLQVRREWRYCSVIKNKGLHPRLLHPKRPSFKIEQKIKSFPDKEELKEFITTTPKTNVKGTSSRNRRGSTNQQK